jgi:Lon protease-like protein
MTQDPFTPGSSIDEVAIFPLPQVVLFPGVLMPLHIFEPRYRAMMRDVLSTTGLLAVAQIPEDHGVDRYGQPEIAPICGVGEIIRHEKLPDGRYNIIVQGRARALIHELPLNRAYRRGRLTILETKEGGADAAEVRALTATANCFAARVRECHPGFTFSLPQKVPCGRIADICAHYLVLDGEERQRLLETLDDGERVRRCLEALMRQETEVGPDDLQ